jgi:hypothetical protein
VFLGVCVVKGLRPSADVPQPDTHPPYTLCCKQRPKCNSTERSTGRSKPFFEFFSGRIGLNLAFFFRFYCSVGRRSQAFVTDLAVIPVFTTGPQLAANLSRNFTFIRLGGLQFRIFGNSGDTGNPKLLFCEPGEASPTPPLVSHLIPVWRRFIPSDPKALHPIRESGCRS